MEINEKIIPGGVLIVFEGADGTGKSTISKLVAEALTLNGYKTLLTREPGGCEESEKIREAILSAKDISIETEISLFATARQLHNKNIIEPALKKGKVIICDRYILSNLVYQGYLNDKNNGGGEFYTQKVMRENLFLNVQLPYMTFIFDLDTKIASERITNRGGVHTKFDNYPISKQEIIREGFKTLKDYVSFYPAKIIDSDRIVEEIKSEILDYIFPEIATLVH